MSLQEDAHIINPKLEAGIGIFAIFDGHGGIEVAKYCERYFESKLQEQQEYATKKDIPKALESTFLGLDRQLMSQKGMQELIAISKEYPNQVSPVERALRFHADKSALNHIKQNQYSAETMEGKGCTANVAMIVGSTIICANAGDSKCVVAENGRAIPLSIDHKPTLKKERERIYKAGSTVNIEGRIDGNLNLSRAIGDLSYKKNLKLQLHEQAITSLPEIKMYQINNKTDFLIMGCDGIWETKTS